MKWKFCACLVVGAMAAAAQAVAAPVFVPFLSVDVNGYNADGGQAKGPTEPGFQDFEAGQGLFVAAPVRWDNSGAAGLTNVYSTFFGNITVNIKGVAPSSTLLSRERGANAGGYPGMYRDFAAAQRGLGGFGQNYIRVQLTGLKPNQNYEFTGFAREAAFNSATDHVGSAQLASYTAWTDLARLGGVDGPGPWMDANVGAAAVYQPIYTDHDANAGTPDVPTGYKNPIPTIARVSMSGPDSLSAADLYAHAATFITKSDATGSVVVYAWSDPNGYGSTSQGATLLNGFQIGEGFAIPEPASLSLVALALFAVANPRHRSR
jgi:hypothetical protein